MENKKILITGGAGSIGSELVRKLAPKNEIYVLDLNETAFFDLYEELRIEGCPIRGQVGNICDREMLKNVFVFFQPEVVFHCAALKHVTPTENNPRPAIETNILGTLNLTEIAHQAKVEKFIFLSSDKAVDGEKIYGNTKKIGEQIVKNAGYICVRFGNVLGSRGSVIPIWQKQLDEGKPLTITDEKMERYFMSVEEACNLVIHAAEIGEPGSLLVMDMGERRKILDIAKEILGKMNKLDYPIKTIGARPGETFIEKLMTSQEEQKAIKLDEFYIIRG